MQERKGDDGYPLCAPRFSMTHSLSDLSNTSFSVPHSQVTLLEVTALKKQLNKQNVKKLKPELWAVSLPSVPKPTVIN